MQTRRSRTPEAYGSNYRLAEIKAKYILRTCSESITTFVHNERRERINRTDTNPAKVF